MDGIDHVRQGVLGRFWLASIKYLEEQSGDRSSIHVTDLVYDCMRRAYYDKVVGDAITESKGLMIVWIGQLLHSMPMCEEHEVSVSYEFEREGRKYRIEGRIDELCVFDGRLVVVDKKTTRDIPRSPYEHHVKQVLMYSFILWKTRGVKPSYVSILYIDVASGQADAFVIPVEEMSLSIIGREMEDKAVELASALESGKPPRAVRGWLCGYCSHFKRCVKDGW